MYKLTMQANPQNSNVPLQFEVIVPKDELTHTCFLLKRIPKKKIEEFFFRSFLTVVCEFISLTPDFKLSRPYVLKVSNNSVNQGGPVNLIGANPGVTSNVEYLRTISKDSLMNKNSLQ
jgi:hypothetical protein